MNGLDPNNLFPADPVQINEEDDRYTVVNLYNEKVAALNDALSKIEFEERITSFNPNSSKNTENVDPNAQEDLFKIYFARLQVLQVNYNALLTLRNGLDIIFNQCNNEYNNMSGPLKSFYTSKDILNLNQHHKKTINDFYETHIIPQIRLANAETFQQNGSRYNKSKSKHTDMNMKDIKELCKANQIKLSKIVNDKTVVYTKKELITKLKRKKLI
jgi:hypothetical protein